MNGPHSLGPQQRLKLVNFSGMAGRPRHGERVGMNNKTINHSHKRMMSGFCSTAIVACFMLAGSIAFAQTSYKVIDLGVLPSKEESVPAAISSQGLVAGTSIAEPSGEAAFRYNPNNPAPMEDIGLSSRGVISRGFGINNTGVVVGDSAFIATHTAASPVRHATLFGDRSRIDLGTLTKQTYSRANSINGFNQVVGFSGPALDTPKSRAFFWSKSTGMVDLGTLGGGYSQAFAINDSGFITGNSQLRSSATDTEAVHAFLSPSPLGAGAIGMRDLGTLGGSFSYGMAINAKNHVVGYSTVNKVDSRVHAFWFDGNGMKDLGTLARKFSNPLEDQSVALGVNSSDRVVGYSYLPAINVTTDPAVQTGTSAVRQVAFVWSEGTMTDLNKLIGASAETYHLNSAVAINDNGQIVATALSKATGTRRAVLLIPSK
jgi:probable HAF family extracellular repeat protein